MDNLMVDLINLLKDTDNIWPIIIGIFFFIIIKSEINIKYPKDK